MIYLLIVLAAFAWLLIETDFLRVRLPVGRTIPRNKLRMTLAEWDIYNIDHEKELAQAKKEYAENQAYYKAHTCLVCKAMGATVLVETKVIKAGNSTCHVTACPKCLEKWEAEIVKSQQPTKPRDPYPVSHYRVGFAGGQCYGYEPDGDIEILVDGKSIASINGDYKRGMIKEALKPYTTKCRVGKKVCTFDVGEADRVK